MNIDDMKNMMVDQLLRRNYYPTDEIEVLLRIGEEVGELYEAVREGKTKNEISSEIIDILWNLMRLCIVMDIDIEQAFLSKLKYNEKRQID